MGEESAKAATTMQESSPEMEAAQLECAERECQSLSSARTREAYVSSPVTAATVLVEEAMKVPTDKAGERGLKKGSPPSGSNLKGGSCSTSSGGKVVTCQNANLAKTGELVHDVQSLPASASASVSRSDRDAAFKANARAKTPRAHQPTHSEAEAGASTVDANTGQAGELVMGLQSFPTAVTDTAAVPVSLQELVITNDIQPLPEPSSAESQQETNPGAHAVGQPGTNPVAVGRVRYSIFGRIRDQSAAAIATDQQQHYLHAMEESANTQHSAQGLVVADLVAAGSSKLLLPQAQVLQDRDPHAQAQAQASKKHRMLAGLAVVFFVAVTVTFLILFRGNNTSTTIDNPQGGEASQDTSSPTAVSLPDHIFYKLPAKTQQSIRENKNSPQALAFQWLVQDPSLTTYPAWRIKQRMALAILFYATNGHAWYNNTNWLSYTIHECQWFAANIYDQWKTYLDQNGYNSDVVEDHLGVGTCQVFTHNFSYALTNGYVYNASDFQISDTQQYHHLRLFANNLKGTLPDEIYWLTSLKTMHFFINDLKGTISPDIQHMQQLEAFEFINNPIGGSLPTQIGLVTTLIGIGLHTTQLSGKIPSQIALLTQLRDLYLDENQISGQIPTQMGLLPHIERMYLQLTTLEGPLPTELGLLSRLRMLSLFKTPTMIGSTLPTQFGQLSSLEELSMYGNSLTGDIPSQLGLLESLSILQLSDNNLQGDIPADLSRNASLTHVDLSGNPQLSGTIPSELCEVPLFAVDCTASLCGCYCQLCGNTTNGN